MWITESKQEALHNGSLFLCHIKEVLRWAVQGSMVIVTSRQGASPLLYCPGMQLSFSWSRQHWQAHFCSHLIVQSMGWSRVPARLPPRLVHVAFPGAAVCPAKSWGSLFRKWRNWVLLGNEQVAPTMIYLCLLYYKKERKHYSWI